MGGDLVSIVIPTYYREDRLREAIESALDQTYENTEVIVVDDSGEEYAKTIVQDYDVQYVPHDENQGGNPARNTGYEAANGDYIQFLDDDDKIFEEKISRQVELLNSSPSADVAYCGIRGRDGNEHYPNPDERGRSLELALQFIWPTTITSTLLISDAVLSDIYPLTNRAAADDIGMKIELAKRTSFDFVDEVLVEIGDSMDSRSSGMNYVVELESIYEEYRSEYDSYPDRVRKSALSDLYWRKAQTLLSVHVWSLSAIRLYALSILYRPNFEPALAFSLLASFFGQPGLTLARQARDRYHGYVGK